MQTVSKATVEGGSQILWIENTSTDINAGLFPDVPG